MGGHLFVVQGDVLALACDAILVPSGTGVTADGALRPGHVTAHWTIVLDSAIEDGFLVDPPDAQRPVVLVASGDGIRHPALWAGFTGDQGDEPLEFFVRAVAAFVREAGAQGRATASATRPLMSPRPLIALPLVGSGAGGRGRDKG